MVEHPAGCAVSSTSQTDTALLPSGTTTPWATGTTEITKLHSHGSHSRVPTYRCGSYLPPRKARFRPAGLRFGRTGFAPVGQILRISLV